MKKSAGRKGGAAQAEKARPAKTVYQLKVALRGIEPSIWRRIVVSGDVRLAKLHRIIQSAMGWQECHMHQFVIAGHSYGSVDLENPGIKKESGVCLADVSPGEGKSFTYVYDMGDEWTHDVRVEAVRPRAAGESLPSCVDGGRACPPEDCGGVSGYEELVEAMRGADTERRRELVEWLGGVYDPEAFSVKDANRYFWE